jgi:hypothetical protein
MTIQGKLAALGLAGALALGATVTASAGPLPIGNSAIKDAAGGQVTDVRWRGRGIGPGLAFGLAAGALAGAAVASRPYGYGPSYYYYDAPAAVYADPYVYDTPTYVAPGYYGGYGYYGNGGCYTDEGYGRRRPCDGR